MGELMAINFDSRYVFNHQFNLMSKLDNALDKEDYDKVKSLLTEWHVYLTDFLTRVKRVSENDKDGDVTKKMDDALSESINLFLSYVDLFVED